MVAHVCVLIRCPASSSVIHVCRPLPAPRIPLIRPFGLRNSLRLQSLARRSAPLQLEQFFNGPQNVLWAAVGAPLPWLGSGAATYLYVPTSETASLYGFVQAVKRVGRPEADVTRIAPVHDADPQAGGIWQRLLERVAHDAGEHGIQRLYLCLENDDEAMGTVTASGYAPYIQETLFRHSGVSTPKGGSTGSWPNVRSQSETDSFALQRLHSRHTPHLVQQAEGMLASNGDGASSLDLRKWWQPERVEGFVYDDSEILAASQIARGRNVHWLHLLGDPSTPEPVAALLACSLDALGRYSERPVFCPLRPYQSSFGPLLRDAGFEPGPTVTRFVKHTTSMVKKPAAVPIAERVEVTLPTLAPADASVPAPARNFPHPA